MKILGTPGFSLFCALFNAAFAINALTSGQYLFGAVCTGFSVFCFRNYLKFK